MMLDILRQLFSEAKAKRMLKRASSILSKLKYEVVDTDQQNKSLAFKFEEDAIALFVIDPSPYGCRLEATIIMPSDLLNLKLLSDITSIAYSYRCSASGLTHSGDEKVRIELVFALGNDFNKSDVAFGLSFMQQCLGTIEERIAKKIEQVRQFSFDLSIFDDEDVPFFSTQMIGERKFFAYGDNWDAYIQSAANKQAVANFTTADLDHDIDVLLACRDFERENDCSLVEIGDLVTSELAKHRTAEAAPEDKNNIN